jgi:proteasome beta subunit
LIGTSSFAEVLSALQPDRLASLHHLAGAAAMVPHGTTIVSLRTSEGVVMAGDRRATMGNIIAQHDIEKVFVADDHSVIGIAGAAGLAVELVRLFQVELEHYEKIEGLPLSLDGKANRLATLLRSNLGLALQGLAVVPLFAGFDLARQTGRIFSYDPTGGRYEEHDFYAVGSGSTFARGSLKKLFRRGAPAADAVRTALEALYDAADDDSATAGPDMARGIYPVVAVVDSAGARILPDAEIAPVVQSMVDARMLRPDGGPQGEEAGS